MAVTQIAVIYSIALSNRRRIIIPSSSDSELNAHTENLQPGEGVYLMPIADYQAVGADVDASLAAYLGKPALSDRCAVVDANGKVTAVIRADPSIDSVANCTLILDADACTGWTYANGVFTPSS